MAIGTGSNCSKVGRFNTSLINMKLNLPEITIERSGVTAEISMGIDKKNQHIIMNMLRNQIYSNSIESLVRELLANAIDAHVACGKADVPIRINLPTNLSEYLEIIDEGASMDKEHIEEVYAQLGSSSKRNNDDLIGSFGIGSASPLSYTDSFFIETKTFEDGKYIKRIWVQYIDETLLGKLSLLEESECDSTGTTIKVAIKREDYKKVEEAVIKYSTFLKVKPITNKKLIFPELEYDYKGEGWASLKNPKGRFDEERIQNTPHVIMGGVPYILRYNDLKMPDDIRNILNYWAFHIFVPIGSVSLTASRENLQFNQETRDYISTIINNALECIKNKIREDLEKVQYAEDYIELMGDMSCPKMKCLIPSLTWNNISINRNTQLVVKDAVLTHIFKKDIWRGGERKFIHRTVKNPDVYITRNPIINFIIDKEGKYLTSNPSSAVIQELLGDNGSKYIVSLNNPDDSKYWESPLLPQEIVIKTIKPKAKVVRGSMKVYTINSSRVKDGCTIYEMFNKNRIFYNDTGFYIKLNNRSIDASPHVTNVDNWNGLGKIALRKLLSYIPQEVPALKTEEIEKLGPNWQYLPDYLASVVKKEDLEKYFYYAYNYDELMSLINCRVINNLCSRVLDIEQDSDVRTIIDKIYFFKNIEAYIPVFLHHSSIEYKGPSLYEDIVNIKAKYKFMSLITYGQLSDETMNEMILYINRTYKR